MKIRLNNARLSYPSLFKPTSFKGSEPKYGATLILDKEDQEGEILKVEKAIKALVKEHFKGNVKVLKGTCLRDGAEKVDNEGEPKDGYGDGVMFVSSSNVNRPQVVDKNPRIELTAEDAVIYAGCRVNAVIEIWAQDNDFGKRINAQLKAVQFADDDEPFGEARVKPEDEFDTIEDEDEDGLG